MSHQFTPSDAAAQSPLRRYASDAVAATQAQRVQLVLRRRIAERLATALCEYVGRPSTALDDLPPNARAWCLSHGAVIVAITESITTTAPPTQGELRRVDAERALHLAQARARCEATRLGHALGPFRPSGIAGDVLASCDHCGASVHIHTITTAVAISELLKHPCLLARS